MLRCPGRWSGTGGTVLAVSLMCPSSYAAYYQEATESNKVRQGVGVRLHQLRRGGGWLLAPCGGQAAAGPGGHALQVLLRCQSTWKWHCLMFGRPCFLQGAYARARESDTMRVYLCTLLLSQLARLWLPCECRLLTEPLVFAENRKLEQ